ncbi:putative GGDEF family protein [Vibrio nigripulchritudo MADA3029]|uniref:GGDEF domain-containing protein n=1 Tax=Vibrio nigripulchritudo TaxID=28173 RepID=UPI0003B211FD|nr:GGDEF domain-containing protein [Vibrio nigripulchritudo]CCN47465.1 putative GGDEF family protein [Vibrio nigripulchritudo MADA3020]CCN55871.1 putative GGDEF family protein [Vibrio nigripulchritudo MADA3021]CCN57095.1 putative GGDEF family protein [Vibrio nigripulchritudo MADA3029]
MVHMDAGIEWLNRSQSFRSNMLKGVSFITLVAGLVYGFLNLFALEQKVLGITELFFSIYSAYLFCYSSSLNNRKLHSAAYVIFLFTLVYLGIYVTDTQNTLFVWLFLCPVVGYLLLGKSTGLKINALMVPIGAAFFYWKSTQPESGLALHSSINVLACLMAIWAIAHVYEHNREQTEEQLTSLALLDPLTRIDNRLSLAFSFEQMVTMHRRKTDVFSMLVVDLDFFKSINDKYGHDVGDEVLRQVAKLLKDSVRRSDSVYRVGGEEFCVLLPYTERKVACAVAEHIRKVLCRNTFRVAENRVNVSASIGVSVYGEDGAQLEDMFKVADDYLYHAKGAGRNQVVYGV